MRLLAPLAVLSFVVICLLGGCSTVLGVDFGAAHLADDASTQDGGGGGGGDACAPKTCASQGFACGTQSDGCTSTIDCGPCAPGSACESGKCACTPTTCPALNAACGTQNDGCGGALNCGTCGGANDACVNGKCTCQPKTCAQQGAECGSIPDGCSGNYDCGSCPPAKPNCGGSGPNKCGANPCTPNNDCTTRCGDVSDGCGKIVHCPATCPSPQTCGGGGKANVCGCTPTTCAQQAKDCGSIPDACGGTLNCGTCTPPKTCNGAGTPNVCGCTPTTCAALGKSCGPAPDGCGNTLNCGTCTGKNTCGGGGQPGVCGCTSDGSCSKCCGIGVDNCGHSCNDGSCCNPCFAAGTPIAMADGTSKAIDAVSVGDLVKSFDPVTGTVVAATVLETPRHSAELSPQGIVVVNGVLRATTNHPFYVEGRRVRADALAMGDPILSIDRHGVVRQDAVRSISTQPGGIETFDLRVSGPGNFFASDVLVLVKINP